MADLNIFECGFEGHSSYEETGREGTLTPAQIKQIKECKVSRKHTFENGEVRSTLMLCLSNGTRRYYKFSPEKYGQTQYDEGTEINPRSIVLKEFVNNDGETTMTVSCKEA